MSGKGPNNRPIIIRKKAPAHHGHHGGSWKVAYADFVTAMMAFFLVMWIMGMDSSARETIQGYFANPVGFKKGYGAGTNPLSSGNSPQNLDIKRLAMIAHEYQRGRFAAAIEEIEQKLARSDIMAGLRGHIEFVITDEGLRIELLENGPEDVFFASGSAQLKPAAERAINVIGAELGGLANPLVLEGHTDAKPYNRDGYSNWELSVDRANAARRALVAGGTAAYRVKEVRGHADRQLRDPDNPYAPVNRRISILLTYDDSAAPRPIGVATPQPSGSGQH